MNRAAIGPRRLAAVIAAFLATPAPPAAAIECDSIDLAGTRSLEIDRHHLILTRWLEGRADGSEVRLSGLISSGAEAITFVPHTVGGGYRAALHGRDGTALLTAWISDGERDGICAIELSASVDGRVVSDFLQILAVYPGGELALGLPNHTDRIGLIMLGGAAPGAAGTAASGP